jgi:hypothetical protein
MKYIYVALPFVSAMFCFLGGFADGTDIEKLGLDLAGAIQFAAGCICGAIVLSLDERRKKP